MSEAQQKEVMGASAMAKEIGISEAKVKKFIKELGIEPAAKRGACCFYSEDALKQIKAAAEAK